MKGRMRDKDKPNSPQFNVLTTSGLHSCEKNKSSITRVVVKNFGLLPVNNWKKGSSFLFPCSRTTLCALQMIKTLKKTMCPVLSDISIDWLFPETKEVLLSPVGNTFLYPGDSLIGYAVVCDATRYHANPKSVSMMFWVMGMVRVKTLQFLFAIQVIALQGARDPHEDKAVHIMDGLMLLCCCIHVCSTMCQGSWGQDEDPNAEIEQGGLALKMFI